MPRKVTWHKMGEEVVASRKMSIPLKVAPKKKKPKRKADGYPKLTDTRIEQERAEILAELEDQFRPVFAGLQADIEILGQRLAYRAPADEVRELQDKVAVLQAQVAELTKRFEYVAYPFTAPKKDLAGAPTVHRGEVRVYLGDSDYGAVIGGIGAGGGSGTYNVPVHRS